jgi:hypothetical protein
MRRLDDLADPDSGPGETTAWDEQEAAEFGLYSFEPAADYDYAEFGGDPDPDPGDEPEWL